MEEENKKAPDLIDTEYSIEAKTEEVQVSVPKQQEDDFASLPHLEKIRLAAAQHGVIIKEKPNKNCKKCLGKGYVSTTSYKVSASDGVIEQHIPTPCKCLFEKEDYPKMFSDQIRLGRSSARRHKKQLTKEATDKKNGKLLNIEAQALAKKKRNERKKKNRMMKKHNKRK